MTTPDLRTEPRKLIFRGAAKIAMAGLCGIVMIGLQACATTSMPQPKYPIYMQDKPAEAVETVGQAGDDVPAPVDTSPSVTPMSGNGGITTTELAPPPPPPPPVDDTATAPAPTPTATIKPQAPTAAPVKDTRAAYVYVLEAHDTLYGVSRRFGVPVHDLYDINGLSETASLRIGQKILLPASAVDKGVEEHANGAGMVKLATALASTTKPAPVAPAKPPVTTTTTTTVKTTTKPAVTPPVKPPVTTPTPVPTKPAVTQPVTKPVATPVVTPPVAGFPTNNQISQMGRGMFVWPVKGRILVPFGQLAPNVRNDGINIQASSGTEIRAASDGIVVYEGDQVKELGNTVYIKHPNGWYTGYSHMANMSVKNNEKVSKGQVIGTVGQTGVIDQPQLHFEIRYTPSTDIARPIDPNLVLP